MKEVLYDIIFGDDNYEIRTDTFDNYKSALKYYNSLKFDYKYIKLRRLVYYDDYENIEIIKETKNA